MRGARLIRPWNHPEGDGNAIPGIDGGDRQRQTHQFRIRKVLSDLFEHVVRCLTTLDIRDGLGPPERGPLFLGIKRCFSPGAQGEQTLFKSDEDVLSDFLTAYRNHDDARAQEIHDETKGLLRGATVPLQLSRRYLLAKQRGSDAEAKESIEALTYIGNFEQAQHSEFFFLN